MCLGLFDAVGLGFGIPAWMMGNHDLTAMKSGMMDAAGQGATNAGWIMGIIGVVISSLGILAAISLFVIQIFLMANNPDF